MSRRTKLQGRVAMRVIKVATTTTRTIRVDNNEGTDCKDLWSFVCIVSLLCLWDVKASPNKKSGKSVKLLGWVELLS